MTNKHPLPCFRFGKQGKGCLLLLKYKTKETRADPGRMSGAPATAFWIRKSNISTKIPCQKIARKDRFLHLFCRKSEYLYAF